MEETYIDMLKQEFLDRKERRPQYSERAFARDLNLSSGFISLLFNNKRGLSPRMSVKILENLNWNECKTKKFLDSIQSVQFQEKKIKTKKKVKGDTYEYEMDLEYFRLIANMSHFMILEFIQTRKVKSIQEISNYFDIDFIECEMIIKRLERLKLIEITKNSFCAINENRKLKGTPSAAIRSYHKESINKSLSSIDNQSFNTRELRSVTVSINKSELDEAKAAINKFVKNFMKKFGNKQDGEIYQLNLQLFSHNKNVFKILEKKERS